MTGGHGHIPKRTCVGCRALRPQSELARVAIDHRGPVTLSTGPRRVGRGAYLCLVNAAECLAHARRRRGLTRSLRVSEEAIDYAALTVQVRAVSREESPSPP